jgi:hypothetical protein
LGSELVARSHLATTTAEFAASPAGEDQRHSKQNLPQTHSGRLDDADRELGEPRD